MKKLLALLLAMAMLLCCAACKQTPDKKEDADTDKKPAVSGQINAPKRSAVDAAIGMFEALGKADVQALISYMPDYNFPYIVAAGRTEGWEPEAGLSDKEAVTKLFEERLSAMLGSDSDKQVASMDFDGEETSEGYFDLLETLREGATQTEGMDASLLDAVTEVTWVKISGTVTYTDGTTEEDDDVIIPCVKIDGEWYADLFSVMFIPVRVKNEEVQKQPIQ